MNQTGVHNAFKFAETFSKPAEPELYISLLCPAKPIFLERHVYIVRGLFGAKTVTLTSTQYEVCLAPKTVTLVFRKLNILWDQIKLYGINSLSDILNKTYK